MRVRPSSDARAAAAPYEAPVADMEPPCEVQHPLQPAPVADAEGAVDYAAAGAAIMHQSIPLAQAAHEDAAEAASEEAPDAVFGEESDVEES